jgi:hypothetical protein
LLQGRFQFVGASPKRVRWDQANSHCLLATLARIISELFDQYDFEEALNRLLAREGLAAYFDLSGRCYVRNTGNRD